MSEHRVVRVGLGQFKPRKADVSANLGYVRKTIAELTGHTDLRADLLVLPEACLSGYFLEGGVAEAARSSEEIATELGAVPHGAPDVVLGFYERHNRRLFNSVGYFAVDGDRYRTVHVHRKVFLPTYGVFDEARFVEPGREIRAFDTRWGRMGMLICEDMWHSLSASILALDGAEVILAVSASPARDFTPSAEGLPGNLERWETVAPAAATEHGIFVLVSQLVGSEGGKIFPGGSIAVSPSGEVLERGPLFEEAVTLVSLDTAVIDRVRTESPFLSDLEQVLPHLERSLVRTHDPSASSEPAPEKEKEEPPATFAGPAHPMPTDASPDDLSVLELDVELVERVLVRFIRDEVVERRGFQRVVIGLSGGVDSSVSAFLAARALGPENVFGFRLPYATSSEESLDHAQLVIEATGITGRTIEITPMVDGYVGAHEPDPSPLRRGNLAARSRAVILFDQSAKVDGLPLGTGNKSERLLGYYTWHADDSPPINPLGDLLKMQVWALARHLGVPTEIVDKPASADLVQGVHDEDELGISYRRADPILHWILKGYRPEELIARGFAETEVGLVWKRLNSTHWKRELPTVAVLSSSAIGEFYLRPVDY